MEADAEVHILLTSTDRCANIYMNLMNMLHKPINDSKYITCYDGTFTTLHFNNYTAFNICCLTECTARNSSLNIVSKTPTRTCILTYTFTKDKYDRYIFDNKCIQIDQHPQVHIARLIQKQFESNTSTT